MLEINTGQVVKGASDTDRQRGSLLALLELTGVGIGPSSDRRCQVDPRMTSVAERASRTPQGKRILR
jgi:hypothetical protein